MLIENKILIDKNILKHILLMVQYLFQKLKPIKRIVHFLIIKLIT